MKKPTLPPAHHQRGVSLLEVMIAVLILSFGLLGLAGLQMTTLRNNQSSFERSRAIMAVYSIADSLRADMKADGTLDVENGFAAAKIAVWEDSLETHLGEGATGTVECTAETTTPLTSGDINVQTCTVTITWDDSRGVQGSSTQTMTTQVRL